MIRALNTAATGMHAQEENVNTISNNIANVNTVGFKKSRTEFEDLLYETVKEPGAKSGQDTSYNVGKQMGSGVKVTSNAKEHTQGGMQITNNVYDLMINGEGFFGVMVDGKTTYTRDGTFNVSPEGVLQTKKGYNIYPGITVPPNAKSINISESGDVDVYLSDKVEPVRAGTIPIFTFINPKGLKDLGGNLSMSTTASGAPMENIPGKEHAGTIQQGALEVSNVNVMNEMTNLIKAQRAYEMNSKVMGVADQMLQIINNIR